MKAARTSVIIAASLVGLSLVATPASGQPPEPEAAPAAETVEPAAEDTAPDVHGLVRSLVGTWELDVEAYMERRGWTEEDRGARAPELDAFDFSLSFGAHGSLTVSSNPEGTRAERLGRWTLLEATSRSLRLETASVEDDPGVAIITIEFETPDSIVMDGIVPLTRAAEP